MRNQMLVSVSLGGANRFTNNRTMRKLLLFACVFLGLNAATAQQTITDSILHDGIYRRYILYVPAMYSPGNPVPLVMNFHGYTSYADQQMFYGNFRPIADTANFLIVHPQGTLDNNDQPYWNSGWGGTVDDIGFTEALIDSLSAQYSINQDRVYSTGMSNGGFMSYTLACELSHRIAAIASVTGSMNASQNLTCNPQHPMPVMEIHGTADGVVPYAGSVTMAPIAQVLSYWVSTNVCDVTPIQTEVPNTNLVDGCTATHFRYTNGNNGVEVEHFRINNGAHTWPGAPVVVGTTNYDIKASVEIWRFFSRYDINGLIVGLEENAQSPLRVYPNPTSEYLYVDYANPELIESIAIMDQAGVQVFRTESQAQKLDLKALASGLYFLRIDTAQGSFTEKFIFHAH